MPEKPAILMWTANTPVRSIRPQCRRRSERGSAYVLALVALMTGLTLSLALLTSSNGMYLAESSRTDKDIARYLADSGVEYASWKAGVNGVSLPYSTTVAMTGGTFSVTIEDDSDREPGAGLVTSTGRAGDCTYVMKRVIPCETQVIVDNQAGTCSANWSTSTASADKYGPDYRWRPTGLLTDSFTYRPNIPESGNYEVFAWWAQGTNRCTATQHVINYNGGSATVAVNQQAHGGTWNSLGTYNFTAGTSGTVVVLCWGATGKIVVADGLRLVRRY